MNPPAALARPGNPADVPYDGGSSRPPLLVFAAQRWAFDWQRPQQLLTRLAKHYRVFYVEAPLTTHQDAYLECTVVARGVTVLVPHTRCGVAGLHDAQMPVVRGLLAAFVREQRIVEPLAWLDTPAALPLLEGLAPRGVIYDCHVDPALLGEAAARHEAGLLRAADVVLAGGPSLYEARRGRHASVHCIANAVDAAHFAPPARGASGIEAVSARAIHADLHSPRLGWFGVVDERLDLALLAAIADRRPDWQIVMAGPVLRIAASTLPQRPNIHWLGAQTYAILPHLQAHWDVCLLPFKVDACAHHAAPIEALEYLAGQKSVVSTSAHDVVALHGHIVRVADGAAAFVEACRAAMCERGPLRRQRSIDALIAVHSCTWDRTAERVRQLMVEFARAPAPLPQRVPAALLAAGTPHAWAHAAG
ncbi:MAG: glycosyltransferase [Betaproteobacteria bacterium]